MTNVIDFTARLNAKRAVVKAREIAEATEKRIAEKTERLANKMGGSIGAHVVASVMVDMEQREQASRPTPAYCDPSNEVRGAKHDATRSLDVAEIAKRMRADIKALKLAKGIKVSVRTRRYSGGQSIDMDITALPDDFRVMSEAGASWKKQFGTQKQFPGHWSDMQSDELKAITESLKAIHSSYNRDNSDAMTDYFDVRYYGSVSLDWRVRSLAEARDVEDSAGTYWGE